LQHGDLCQVFDRDRVAAGEGMLHRYGQEPGLGHQDRTGTDAGLVHGEGGQGEVDLAAAQPGHQLAHLCFADLHLALGMATSEHLDGADEQTTMDDATAKTLLDEPAESITDAFTPGVVERLRDIKRRHDPHQVFRANFPAEC
jgi:hypothetical protein